MPVLSPRICMASNPSSARSLSLSSRTHSDCRNSCGVVRRYADGEDGARNGDFYGGLRPHVSLPLNPPIIAQVNPWSMVNFLKDRTLLECLIEASSSIISNNLAIIGLNFSTKFVGESPIRNIEMIKGSSLLSLSLEDVLLAVHLCFNKSTHEHENKGLYRIITYHLHSGPSKISFRPIRGSHLLAFGYEVV